MDSSPWVYPSSINIRVLTCIPKTLENGLRAAIVASNAERWISKGCTVEEAN